MKAYQAYAPGGFCVTAEYPSDAAILFFKTFPNKRKCNVVEGITDGKFFTVTYGRKSEGSWPQSWKNITRKDIGILIGVKP